MEQKRRLLDRIFMVLLWGLYAVFLYALRSNAVTLNVRLWIGTLLLCQSLPLLSKTAYHTHYEQREEKKRRYAKCFGKWALLARYGVFLLLLPTLLSLFDFLFWVGRMPSAVMIFTAPLALFWQLRVLAVLEKDKKPMPAGEKEP